jgi:deazaflavin-dependent oxidoreductase (nitroreductase family)
MPRIPAADPTRELGPVTRALHAFGMSRAGRWYGIHIGARIDPVLLRVTRGRFATTSFFPLLLLHVRGRRSGERRTVTLVYFTEGDDVVLVASSFGRPSNPAWFHNLMASPEVELEAGGVRGTYRPRLTEGEERRRLYELARRNYAGYANYEEMAREDREIPVVALRPAA